MPLMTNRIIAIPYFSLCFTLVCMGANVSAMAAAANDSDRDGLSDTQEAFLGTLPNLPDSDGGGAHDGWEIQLGSDPLNPADDKDLPPDQDADNDGVLDTFEGNNIWDKDSDGDGMSDANEIGLPDVDNDGFLDDLTDFNGNGIPDVAEAQADLPLPDADGDGYPNHLDKDSDNDGVVDLLEYSTRWVPPNYAQDPMDVDGDGIINAYDLDSDNDGKFDFDEQHIETYTFPNTQWAAALGREYPTRNHLGQVREISDTDGDGVPDLADSDAHGGSDVDSDHVADIADIHTVFTHAQSSPDNNNDGIIDYFIWDMHKDGSLAGSISQARWIFNNRSDSIPDIYDDNENEAYEPPEPNANPATLDFDRDGVSNADESIAGTNPLKKDTDGGGANDDWELQLGSNPLDGSDDSSLPIDLDLDNDGVPNELEGSSLMDADSDRDGLSDANEIGLIDADNDGFLDDLTDTNQNGIPDVAEALAASVTGLPDFDRDGMPDHLDADSDNDGVHDHLEYDTSWVPDGFIGDPLDVDGDGMRNGVDLDSDNDGKKDFYEQAIGNIELFYNNKYHFPIGTADGQVKQLIDVDQDGIPFIADYDNYPQDGADHDGDGIADRADIDHAVRYDNINTVPERMPTSDIDGDGIERDYDWDSNNDGALDYSRDRHFILDSDNDGIPRIFDADDQTASQQPRPDPQQEPDLGEAYPGANGGNLSIWMGFALFLSGFFRTRHQPLGDI